MAIPVFDLSRVIGWVKTAAADVVKWLALRALILGVVGTLVPIAIYKGFMLIQEQLITYVSSQMNFGDIWNGTMVQLTGLAAWLADKLEFQACFTLLATALSFRFVLGFFKR